jgi:uncharacterized cupin superfamily protein
MPHYPAATIAHDVPTRTAPSLYPEPFASQMKGREKKVLSAVFGLTNITVNLTRIVPGGKSALRHAHKTNDEFVYILQGNPTLVTNQGPTQLSPGMCAGFKAGSGDAHQLLNNTSEDVLYIEAGDNLSEDGLTYPDDDLKAEFVDGKWKFTHKDGSEY